MKILLISLLFLSGCANNPPPKLIQNEGVKVTLINDANLPALRDGKPQLARTTVGDGFCLIELTKYPKCLLHEIRHCFEGDWHKGRETTQDC